MNRMIGRILSLVAVLACTAASARGQEQPQPSPEHAMLKKYVGTWDTTMRLKAMPGDHKGVCRYEMLGEFYVLGTFEGSFGGMKFTGKSYDGFDPKKKKYVGAWIDSLSPHPMNMEGTYDERTKVLTTTGDGVGMDGTPVKVKGMTTFKDDDTFTFVMHEGKDVNSMAEVMSIEYKRRK